MARRKKEEPVIHQNRIALGAEKLFSKKGIRNTSMDDIAKAAGYSKATLYVYFKDKEEIVGFLALKSMTMLKDSLTEAMGKNKDKKAQFFSACQAMVDYHDRYPDFFDMSLKYIPIDTRIEEANFLTQTFAVGEEINEMFADYLKRDNEPAFESVFHIWGMITGLIKLASEKEEYLLIAGGLSKEKFLQDGFERIYKYSIL